MFKVIILDNLNSKAKCLNFFFSSNNFRLITFKKKIYKKIEKSLQIQLPI